jgi:phosphoglycerate dehydrogenase-like enzyme
MRDEMKRIMLVRSTGFPQEWVDEMQSYFPKVRFVVADDNEQSIYGNIEGIHALIGCPRPLFTVKLLQVTRNSLEWVHASGAGIEEFLFPEFARSPVIFTNGKIIQGPEVSDHAVALLLVLARSLHYLLRGKGPRPMPRPLELRGKTALVYGVGGIGILLAEKLKAFGMRVIAVDDDYLPMVSFIDEFYLTERLPENLPRAEAVICCSPNTERSRFVFNEEAFRAMGRDAFFINVSRGQLVQTEALVKVLKEGHLRGVGLDVTDPEPLPEDHPLRGMDRVVITPHIAGPSDQNRRRSFELIKDNITRFLEARPLVNVVDKARGY